MVMLKHMCKNSNTVTECVLQISSSVYHHSHFIGGRGG